MTTPPPQSQPASHHHHHVAPQHHHSKHHAAMSVSEQQLRIHQELTAVAYAHAPAFVDAAQSVAAAEQATNECRRTSDSLQSQLAAFRVAAHNLQESGNVWRKQRQLAAAAQGSMSKLTELLEAPQTVEQCIRGGMFHEALMAVQHVRGLQQRHGASFPVLGHVVDEINDTLERLLTTFVLSQLSGPLVPSNALKLIMFLQSLANQQLQQQQQQQQQGDDQNHQQQAAAAAATGGAGASVIATDPIALPELFLSLRSEYVLSAMREAAALSGGSSFSCLQKVLAIFKVHVSEAVATFKTCFIDSETTGSSNSTNNNNSAITEARRDLLCRWSSEHASKLISLFAAHVANLTSGADIAILLDPVAQCGASLGKAGLDVSVALEGLLVSRAEELFLQNMAQASSSFTAALGAHRWRSVVELRDENEENSVKKSTSSGQIEDNNDNNKSTAAAQSGHDGVVEKQQQQQQPPEEDPQRQFVPPMTLLRFPPLAHAMNSFLAACNDVRKCALRGIRPVCLRSVLRLLETVSAQLAAARGSLLLEGAELESLRVMVRSFAEYFVPHVERCTKAVFFESNVNDDDDAELLRDWTTQVDQTVKSLRAAVQ